MDSFSLWAPWVFSALAGIIGWLLRGWYNDRQFAELQGIIKTKEEDLYHFNEAHNLVLIDKEKKLTANLEEIKMKDRVILELKEKLSQTETSTKSLLSTVVKSKEKKPSGPSIVTKISEQAKKKKERREQPLQPTKSVALKSKKGNTPTAESTAETTHPKIKLSKLDRYRLKLKKRNKIIKDLRAENDRLNATQQSKSKESESKPIETITKVLITKTVDYKKLKKALKNIPFKKTKKVISKKKKEA